MDRGATLCRNADLLLRMAIYPELDEYWLDMKGWFFFG
jgi:hypothetical protein